MNCTEIFADLQEMVELEKGLWAPVRLVQSAERAALTLKKPKAHGLTHQRL